MSMAKLLPFKQVTFLIPLALISKFYFQFFTGAMEEENEAGQWLGSGHIIALLQFSQVVEAHARNLDPRRPPGFPLRRCHVSDIRTKKRTPSNSQEPD